MIYHFLDWFFLIFHTFITLFNLFGWIWNKTRIWNLFTLLITGFFWFVVGIFYGFGYCPLTDWHFQVLYKLGINPDTNSYIAYIINRVFGFSIETRIVEIATLIGFMIAIVISTILNIKDYRLRKIER